MRKLLSFLLLFLLCTLSSCEAAPRIDGETTDSVSETVSDTESPEEIESEITKDAETEAVDTEAVTETDTEVETEEVTDENTAKLPAAPEGKNLIWLCTASVSFSSDSVVTSGSYYSYDQNGNLIRADCIDSYELTYDDDIHLDHIVCDSEDSYQYDFENGLLIESSYMPDVRYFTYYTYDENNRLVSEIEYEYLSTTEIRYKKEYTYDRFGNLATMIYIDNSDESQRIYERHEYSVNEDNRLEHKYLYNENGDLLYHMHIHYNTSRTEDHYHYDSVNSCWEHSFYVFDAYGNKTASSYYDENGNVLYGNQWEYTYNEYGYVTQIKYNDSVYKIFEYDSYGNLIKITDPSDNSYTVYYYIPILLTDEELLVCRKNELLYSDIIECTFIIDGVTKESQYSQE